MKTTTYKGFNIIIEKDCSAHPDRAYVAYINHSPGGSEHTRGNSEANALSLLKNRIDNYAEYNRIHYMPLSEEKRVELISYIREHANEIGRIIRREHYIAPNRFYVLTAAAIYNHYDLIQDTLNSSQVECTLDIAHLKNNVTGCIEKILLYDTDYFSTPARRQQLENILLNL